jgi:hypothetical protein
MAKPVESSKPCFKCGQTVVKCESKNGKFYIANIDIVTSKYADDTARGKAIYRAHDCNEHEIAQYQVKIARELAEGAIVKGQEVIVVGGRKVPKGTKGVVFWIKETRDYDRSIIDVRIGFKDVEENVYWTNAKNVIATNQLQEAK